MSRPTTSDNFEDVYLRSTYLGRIDHSVPSRFNELYNIYATSIKSIGGRFCSKNHVLFRSMGFDHEDVISFCEVQAWSYISNFSIITKPEAMEKFLVKRKSDYPDRPDLTSDEIRRKDNSNFMTFLTQRLSDLVRVFKQKNRNIRGTKEISSFYLKTKQAQDVTQELIVEDPEKYGFIQLTKKDVLDLKKRVGPKFKYADFSFEGHSYIYISYVPSLSKLDVVAALNDPHSNLFYMSPDAIMEYEENAISSLLADIKIKEFSSAPKSEKIQILKDRKKQLTQEDIRVKMMIDKKIMELTGGNKTANT